MGEIKADKTIDARGSYCPGPLMELIKNVKSANVGEILEVLSSDEGSTKDIPEWVDKVGHENLGTVNHGDYSSIFVKKVK